ncbi:MAG: amidase [Acidimicrobiales bacterium]
MAHDEILFWSATDLAGSVARREISAVELLELQFAQVDVVNAGVNAVVWQDRDRALAEARRCDAETAAGQSRGPLHGVPITVKEAFDLAGSPSTWGNPEWIDNVPTEDAGVVERYRTAGAVIFGKTNVPLNLADWQTYNDIYGTTMNPWDHSRGPGGSSGGSAAALCSGMAALEAGSDIGSSIRNPAHYCGVFGLKPTWGVVPMRGQLPPGWSGDIDIAVTGPMARSAVDLDLAFGVLAGASWPASPGWATAYEPDDRQRLDEFKIAVKLGDDVCPVDEGYLAVLERFANDLADNGATVSFGAEPDLDRERYFDLYLTLLGAAMSFGSTPEAVAADRAGVAAVGHDVVTRIGNARLGGRELSHADWHLADEERRAARRSFDAFFADWDVLVAPVAASAAFPHDQHGARYERFITVNGHQQPEMLQLFWSGYSGVIGLPSVVGPAGFADDLPVGYQAITGYGQDRTALAFAAAVEREIGGFVAPPL